MIAFHIFFMGKKESIGVKRQHHSIQFNGTWWTYALILFMKGYLFKFSPTVANGFLRLLSYFGSGLNT